MKDELKDARQHVRVNRAGERLCDAPAPSTREAMSDPRFQVEGE